MSKVYFSSVKRKIKELVNKEEIYLPRDFINHFLGFLSNACNYEEEENKIRPRLLLVSNIHRFRMVVPNNFILKIAEGKKSGKDLNKILKSILPFCNNGWIVYIDTNPNGKYDTIEYGILRSFSGPKGLSFTEVLFQDHDYKSKGLIDFEIINNFEISASGLDGEVLNIDFRLVKRTDDTKEDILNLLSEDFSKHLQGKVKENIIKTFTKLMSAAVQRIHGTICLVVDKDAEFPNEILSDGIWFDSPIDMASIAQHSIEDTRDIFLSEKYYGISGLFIEMLNMDGITVINSKGEILGYNVFIKSSIGKKVRIEGGARKRAAETLASLEDERLIGVYFQSQDGSAFYKRVIKND